MDLKQLYYGAGLVHMVLLLNLLKKKRSHQKKVWCRNWLKRRNEKRDVLAMLNHELLLEDPSSYTNFLRMSSENFELLLNKVSYRIAKQDTVMRESIPARCRLQITLRFLATGESFKSLMYLTRVHHSTIGKFVPEVMQAIIEELKSSYLKVPNNEADWKEISKKFYDLWDFPHCLGALDGRHIVFNASEEAGSFYRNYKGTDSIVLLGLVDAEYKFIYCHIGTNGRISDGGVLRESGFLEALEHLNIPPSEPIGECTCEIPYVMVADDAFPLTLHIMKPYAQRGLTNQKRIYNYRLSRARRIVENAFGILANRFRVLLNSINLSVEKVENITLCCVALHNFLAIENKDSYIPIMPDNVSIPLERLAQQCGNRCSQNAQNVRDKFKDFFNSPAGSREWQDAQVAKNNM